MATLCGKVVQCVKRLWPFRIDALVVLPNHLHTIWTLPERDANFSKRWRGIKARFTRRLATRGSVLTCDPRGEYGLGQRRFWEHPIRDEEDFARYVHYIHYNPVKHGWVARPLDWHWSSNTFIWGWRHRIGRPHRRKASSANDSRIPLRFIQATLAPMKQSR